LEEYENKWISIDGSEERIVGVGDNAFEATGGCLGDLHL
jgi:hypothetical protein